MKGRGMKIIYMPTCPIGKRYIMNGKTWFFNGKRVLPKENGIVEVRHPSEKPKKSAKG